MARFPHHADTVVDDPTNRSSEVVGDVAPPRDVVATGAAEPARRAEVSELRTGRSAASTTYVGVGVGLLVLVVVLVFIIQNLDDAKVNFFSAHFTLPLGLIILAAAVAGGLIVLLASAARVIQLRRAAAKHRKADARAQRSA